MYLDWLVYPWHDVGEQPGVERPAEGVPGAARLTGAEISHQTVRAELEEAGEKATTERMRVHTEQLAHIVQFCQMEFVI